MYGGEGGLAEGGKGGKGEGPRGGGGEGEGSVERGAMCTCIINTRLGGTTDGMLNQEHNSPL